MRPFDYATPANMDEAIALLDSGGGAASVRPLAGGTDLLTLMKADITAPRLLVDVKQVDGLHAGINQTPVGLSFGALTTLTEIETSALVQDRFPLLAEAARLAATPQLRNVATVGGNLLQRTRCWYYRNSLFNCWLKGGEECQARDGENQQHAIFDLSPCVAVHPSDPATALTALDAEVTLCGPRGERTLPISEFFHAPQAFARTETTVWDDEILTAIHVPFLPAGTRSVYLKAMDRKVWAFALVSVAAVIQMEPGKMRAARLALGGVANVPRRATEAEQMLLGAAPDETTFGRAADAALANAVPLAHNGYKVPLAHSLIVRALQEAAAA
jgi:xanthine dehydrogenase YagS FAD-binding subunit